MAVLSDRSIRERLRIGEIIPAALYDRSIYDAVQPASLELTISDSVIRSDDSNPLFAWAQDDPERIYIRPREFLLGSTRETVHIPNDLLARVEGKSSWARRGLMVHVTAGFIDPGFRGQITLELYNLSTVTQVILVGSRVAQLALEELDRPADRPYGSPGLGSHYQDQQGATPGAGV